MSEFIEFTDRDLSAHNVNPAVHDLLKHRSLILASNRGPVTLRRNEQGNVEYQRGSGGLVTALAGVIQHAEACWIACARTPEDAELGKGLIPLGVGGEQVWMKFLTRMHLHAVIKKTSLSLLAAQVVTHREAPCKGLERAVHIGEVTGSSPVKTTKHRCFCLKSGEHAKD